MGARNKKNVQFYGFSLNLFKILREKMQKTHITHVKSGLFRLLA